MKKVVVAIDFGTSGTTYAFAFLDDKEDIIEGNWKFSSQIKPPTEIILDDIFNIKVFGYDCKDFLVDKSSSEELFYYFKDIKMELYKSNNEISANNNGNKKQPLAFVISKILSYIKTKAFNEIKAKEPMITLSDIEWKVTVPAIWKNESKNIMLKACQSAGIFNQDEQSTFFALEPEAAACEYAMNNPNSNAILPGKTYIVCDIGGGTVDISTHKRVEENGQIYIEEVYPPIGGNNGSTFINKRFLEEVIIKLFGENAMKTIIKEINNPLSKHDIYDDYNDFLEDIEEFKISISEEKMNDSRRINCNLFSKFINPKTNIDDLISKFNNQCKNSWRITKNNEFKIYFPYQIMIDLTKETIVDKVVAYLRRIISDIKTVNSIIFAGSVSSNNFVISNIERELNNNNINIYLSKHPALSVVKGAVIFGLNPYVIKNRVSKYTIGIKCHELWDDLIHGTHPEKKYFDIDENRYNCKDVFSPIIKRNQKIKVDEIISKSYIIKGSKTSINFYKTLYNNVKFVDEKFILNSKCKKFGDLIFDVGDKYDKNDQNLIIELKLGGTFIYAIIKYKKESRKINFDFESGK